ncbi:YciI family protein [Ornithinimicrobium sp. F0845]|uniref:YciI family protein n=1 Tax=Ornithinimicrobium sp. F0845 TaxID=2926412 RepID=UPI001FF1F355|nr:YciI family protein [Ornithinimicrobium sp. F0845]MCK0111549.1 YciI family protein [Ornithinimicrobium sp. F0845]
MSRYLILLPAPEAEWAELPAEAHEHGQASHGQFHQDPPAGGHEILVTGPLEPSADATSMRPDGSGGTLVTDGPFTESVEQIVGVYLIKSDDEADLRDICARSSSRGELIEFRKMAE